MQVRYETEMNLSIKIANSIRSTLPRQIRSLSNWLSREEGEKKIEIGDVTLCLLLEFNANPLTVNSFQTVLILFFRNLLSGYFNVCMGSLYSHV